MLTATGGQVEGATYEWVEGKVADNFAGKRETINACAAVMDATVSL